jgi:hypothetical protein
LNYKNDYNKLRETTETQGHGGKHGEKGIEGLSSMSYNQSWNKKFRSSGTGFQRFSFERNCFTGISFRELDITSSPPCASVPLWLH